MSVRSTRTRIVALGAALAGAGLPGCHTGATGRSVHAAEIDTIRADRTWLGAARFTFDDFGGITTDALETNAVPWKLAAAALALDHSDRTGAPLTPGALADALRTFGFIVPARIVNWPAGPPPWSHDRPIGVLTGRAGRSFPVRYAVDLANLGCAACHAGVTYDARGMPGRDVWLGLPNTSLDLDAFTWAVYRSLGAAVQDRPRLLGAVRTLFPDTDTLEIVTLRDLLLPRVARRLAALAAAGDTPAPYPLGAPGTTNGVGALKRVLGTLPPHPLASETGFTSIPALGDVLLRSSFLSDGVLASAGDTRFRPLAPADVTAARASRVAAVVAFFTVPAMGNDPDRAEALIPRVEDAIEFLRGLTAPPFPAPIDTALAAAGREVYAARCAACHGAYVARAGVEVLASFPNRLVPLAEIGSDGARLAVVDAALLDAIRRTAYRRHVDVAATGGYVAPRLAGVWATAPYLHNGSVPTLWHLLHPGTGPARFEVGGHRLDLERVGIAGVLDSTGTWRDTTAYRPWSGSRIYDVARPGFGNGGHEREVADLSEADRRAVLEYLKRL